VLVVARQDRARGRRCVLALLWGRDRPGTQALQGLQSILDLARHFLVNGSEVTSSNGT
jgi:hypothetical protein